MKTLVLVLALSLWSTWATANPAETVPFHAAIDIQVQPTGPCGPGCLSLSITGTGQGRHFGRMAIEGPSQLFFATFVQTGTSTLTAADGSTIVILLLGTFLPGPTPADPVTFEGDWIIVSGTGRFQNESGSGTYEGSSTGPVGVLYLNGTLSNPGNH